jgi:cystathionine beta-lyase/cystathionine gamma-synthase
MFANKPIIHPAYSRSLAMNGVSLSSKTAVDCLDCKREEHLNSLANAAKLCEFAARVIDSTRLQSLVPYPLSWSQKQDEKEDLEMAAQRFQSFIETIGFYNQAFDRYVKYCHEAGLDINQYALNVVEQIKMTVDNLVQEHEQKLYKQTYLPSNHQQKMMEVDQIYRSLLNLQTPLARVLSWTAQVYRSSKVPQFFDGAKTKKEGVNYDRVQSPRVNFIESQFMRLHGFDEEKVEILMTCSGTAAYSILEKYLAIHVLKPGDKVLIAPTMYDEHQDWAFRGNTSIQVVIEDLFDATDIVECIKKISPKVVFIDPLKNRINARVTDLRKILKELSQSWTGDELYFIIDDTMLPATFDPFAEVSSNEKLKVFICSSAGKYLEIGQDICIAGLLAYPKVMGKRMKNIRMFHGSVLSDTVAWSYPNFDRQYFEWRMRRMTRNALIFAEILSRHRELKHYFKPIFPALPDHPDSALSNTLPYLGGTVNLHLLPQVENPKETLHDILDEMILAIIEQGQKDGASICWGEAVGFGVPRLGVHFEWLWRAPPYLRLVAGDRSILETISSAHSIAEGLASYIKNNRDKFILNQNANNANALICANSPVGEFEREEMSYSQWR